MQKPVRIFALLMGVFLLFGLCACSQGNTSEDATAETILYGEVTAIDGANITLSLGTLNEQGGAENSASSAQPGSTPPEDFTGSPPPDNEGSDTAPSLDGRLQGGSRLTLTGESKTITVCDETEFINRTRNRPGGTGGKPSDNGADASAAPDASPSPGGTPGADPGGDEASSASLSDIQVGSVLMITCRGDEIVSVEIIFDAADDGAMQQQPSATATPAE